jgi:hypothetical protein
VPGPALPCNLPGSSSQPLASIASSSTSSRKIAVAHDSDSETRLARDPISSEAVPGDGWAFSSSRKKELLLQQKEKQKSSWFGWNGGSEYIFYDTCCVDDLPAWHFKVDQLKVAV